MTIDERIEAIAQSLELLAGFQRETEARLQKLLSVTETLVTTANTISQLVLQHELRIQRLEGQQ